MTQQKQTGGSCLFPWEVQGSSGLWLYGWPLLVEEVIAALRPVGNGHSFLCPIAEGEMFFYEKDLSA